MDQIVTFGDLAESYRAVASFRLEGEGVTSDEASAMYSMMVAILRRAAAMHDVDARARVDTVVELFESERFYRRPVSDTVEKHLRACLNLIRECRPDFRSPIALEGMCKHPLRIVEGTLRVGEGGLRYLESSQDGMHHYPEEILEALRPGRIYVIRVEGV